MGFVSTSISAEQTSIRKSSLASRVPANIVFLVIYWSSFEHKQITFSAICRDFFLPQVLKVLEFP